VALSPLDQHDFKRRIQTGVSHKISAAGKVAALSKICSRIMNHFYFGDIYPEQSLEEFNNRMT
jgi:hypothetical protein